VIVSSTEEKKGRADSSEMREKSAFFRKPRSRSAVGVASSEGHKSEQSPQPEQEGMSWKDERNSSDAPTSTSNQTIRMSDNHTAMSSATAAKLVEEMMMKQIDICTTTGSILQALDTKGDIYATTQALLVQQESIAKTFATMVHKLIDTTSQQEQIIREHEDRRRTLEEHVQRTAEGLRYRSTQVKTLEDRIEEQQEELVKLYKENRRNASRAAAKTSGSSSSNSSSSSTNSSVITKATIPNVKPDASKLVKTAKNDEPVPTSVVATGMAAKVVLAKVATPPIPAAANVTTKNLRADLSKKNSELEVMKSKLNDSQFLLQAYKERCEKLEATSKTGKTRAPRSTLPSTLMEKTVSVEKKASDGPTHKTASPRTSKPVSAKDSKTSPLARLAGGFRSTRSKKSESGTVRNRTHTSVRSSPLDTSLSSTEEEGEYDLDEGDAGFDNDSVNLSLYCV
jgi:hypothetical protein